MKSPEEIINKAYIEFHNSNTTFKIFESENENIDYHFGILKLEIIEMPIISTPQLVLSTNDMSGSMSDLCKDGCTKIHHMNHTLKNIISVLKEKNESNISMEIVGFHDKIEEIIPLMNLNNCDKTIKQLHKIIDKKLIASNGTNIEIALKNAQNRFESEEVKDFPIKTHIFMTDGNTNEGEESPEVLKHLVLSEHKNIFIGFGLDHDALLLQTFASNKNASYYYVDKIENAGFVFGEVLHEILYTALKNIKITITNGEIYDYMTNTWSNILHISSIISEAKKHIIFVVKIQK